LNSVDENGCLSPDFRPTWHFCISLLPKTKAVKKFLSTSILLAVLLLFNQCKPDSGKDPEFRFEKGFGRSKERPMGTPFAWPAGLRVLDKITTNDDCFYESVRKKRIFGHGDLQVCLNLYNETQAPITVRLPPGFMFISKSLEVQNMLLITTTTIVVPPGEQFFSTLTMMCVNTDRNTPYGDEYEEQPIITDHPALRDLTISLKDKKLRRLWRHITRPAGFQGF
jgi:hypothetical protein